MTRAQTESAPNAPEALLEDPNSPLVIAGQILCVVLPPAVWFAPLPLAPATKHGFAIVGFMVIAWITRAMDYALAGFIGCFLFWALGIVKFPVAFSGFANDTAWFLFGALLLGVIATRSGVALETATTTRVPWPRLRVQRACAQTSSASQTPAGRLGTSRR